MSTQEKEPVTVVVFRRWRDGRKTAFALFPEIPHDAYGVYCSSYERIGQHAAADADGCVRRTDPANPQDQDVRELAVELRRIGYRLKIATKLHQSYREKRHAAAKAYRESAVKS